MGKEIEKILEARNIAAQKRSFKQEKFRAQSIMVGKVGSGTTEISLRGLDGSYLFIVLHPTEIIELLHQLAANTGCTVDITPREDFASYRSWPNSTQEKNNTGAFVPHATFTAGFEKIGLSDTVSDRDTKAKEHDRAEEIMAANKSANKGRIKGA